MLIEVVFSFGTLSNQEGESFVFSFGVFSVFLNISLRAVGSLSKELAVMAGGEVRDCGVEGGGEGLDGGGDHSGDFGFVMEDGGLVRHLSWKGDSGLEVGSLVISLGTDLFGGGDASLGRFLLDGRGSVVFVT